MSGIRAQTLIRPLVMLVCCAMLMLTGCAGVSVKPEQRQAAFDDAAYGPALAVPTREDIFALTPAMHEWLRRQGLASAAARGRPRPLIDALHEQGRLRIEYDGSRTRTAAEAFEAGTGNCLSLVVLTSALAERLGLAVRYQDMETQIWERHEGPGLDLRIGHVNVLLGPPDSAMRLMGPGSVATWLMVDFLSTPGARPHAGQPIEKARLVAMLLNNRAGEALLAGDLRAAYWHVRAALAEDAQFAHAWNTLGVIHSRSGQLQRAEAALRLALIHDPRHDAAMGNLSGLLAALGRMGEAQEWAARQLLHLPEHPMALFGAGLRALNAGDLAQARRLLERALPLSGGTHELHFALARTYAALGDAARTRRHLALAQEMGPTPQARERYAAKLETLRRLTATP
jgi:Tfp pilus assembly protein PilF